MATKRKWTLLLGFGLIALVGCEKILDVDEPASRQLVLNAIPGADHRAVVFFGHTRFFLDPSNDQPMQGATLRLGVNGTVYTPDSVSRCNYYFPCVLRPLDTLQIEAAAPDGRVVRAHTYVPRMPKVAVGGVMADTAGLFKSYLVDLTLSDSANYPEYYYIAATVRDSGLRYDTWKREYREVDTLRNCSLVMLNPNVTDPSVSAYRNGLGLPIYSRLLFTDSLINGHDEPMQVGLVYTVDTNAVVDSAHRYLREYRLTVQSVTPERWNYIVSANRQSSTSSFFAEQGEVWSNVQNGVGIFAGSSVWEYRYRVEQ